MLPRPYPLCHLSDPFSHSQDAKFVDDIFDKYDVSESGKLEHSEMRQLIMQLNNGQAPSEDEVKMIADAVDRRGGRNDGAIDKDELKEVLLEWRNYKEHAEFIEAKFKQFDSNKQGTLDRTELAALLKDLNEGQEVTQPELDMVIGFSDKGDFKDGQIDKTELIQAVAVWFSSCEQDAGSQTFNDRKAANDGKAAESTEPAPQSSCCNIA